MNSTQLLRVSHYVGPVVPARGSGTDSLWTMDNTLCARVVCELRSFGFVRKNGAISPFDWWVRQLPSVITPRIVRDIADDTISPQHLVFTRNSVTLSPLLDGTRSHQPVFLLPFPGCLIDIARTWELVHKDLEHG